MNQQENTRSNLGEEKFSGCLVRLGWMPAGTLLLVLSFFMILLKGPNFAWDLAFWITAASCVVLRYVDVAFLGGRTVKGEPATIAHWRRYALLLPASALVLWGLAHWLTRLIN